MRVGDLDVSGNKITIEATFNRTVPWSGADIWQGDLVSKHDNPSDCNYLLRPGSAEITTTNGYFKTPPICPIELNKTYHAAFVYDGTTLKFYRNGFLMSQIAASGNLYQNDWQTQIGLYEHDFYPQEAFLGYINEVRIWNVARSQDEIKSYMSQPLPSPQSQPGLLAYYTFDNLLNKKGNNLWNGILGGNAAINKVNPNCAFFPDSCDLFPQPEAICSVNASYDKNLIITGDTTICLGDSIKLETQNIFDFCWKGGSETTISQLPVYLKPFSTTTYVLKSLTEGPNLIINGDFSSGNSGFSSQYGYSSSGLQAGVYNVGSNITAWHPDMAFCMDHTSGSGNMLMVNGANQPNVTVWSQTVSIQPNTNYVFSIWLETITLINPAQLQFVVNGVPLGGIYGAPDQSCLWKQFYSSWNSGNNTLATISIVNMNQQYSGNDFAIDDIFFGTVTPKTDSLTVRIGNDCDLIKITGPLKVCSSIDTVNYTIDKPVNCTKRWSVTIDSSIVRIVSKTDFSVKFLFKQSGRTTIKVNYDNVCTPASDSIDIEVKISPQSVGLPPDLFVCKDTSILLTPNSGFDSYKWQNGATTTSFFVSTPGNYTVISKNYCGKEFRDTFNLIKTLPQQFSVSMQNTTFCQGDTVQFTAKGGNKYAWEPAAAFDYPASSFSTVIVNESKEFKVSITDELCGRDTLIVIPVLVYNNPNITVLKSNDVNCEIDSARLIATGGNEYVWSPQVFITRNLNNELRVKPIETTTYYVQGKDTRGCIGWDSISVYFVKEGQQKFYVPNAFTPNHDGHNEMFKPVFTGPSSKFNFRIYNRWGQLVFQTNTPGKGWDGTFHSIPQPKDVFIYYITAEGACNGKFEQKGTFVLIK
jgi:gliding motility-associated-like protein